MTLMITQLAYKLGHVREAYNTWTVWLVCHLEAESTLRRAHRKPRFIGAVVVDHVVYANPSILSCLEGSE
jgi:hypothetical protein